MSDPEDPSAPQGQSLPRHPARPPVTPASPRATQDLQGGDTSRVADSQPVGIGPFTVLPCQFGRYRVEKLIGSGAMGAVYLAVDTQLDRTVALKIPKVSGRGADKLLKRMETEAKALAKLNYAGICKVYDFDSIEGISFIAMEFVEGEDLKALFKRLGKKLRPAAATQLIMQLARSLTVAHENGIIHRDLKPENIMRRPNGRLVVMDFGLARHRQISSNAERTQGGVVLGSAAYMSPEQASGEVDQIDERSDIYALGVIFFELLTGEWPFSGNAIQIMGKKATQSPPTVLSVNPNCPVPLAEICQKMLAKDKTERFNSCEDLLKAIKNTNLESNAKATIDTSTPLATHMEVSDAALEFREPAASDSPLEIPPESRLRLSGKRFLKTARDWQCHVARLWSGLPLHLKISALCSLPAVSILLGVLFLQTQHGVLQIDIADPSISVRFDKNTITIDNDGRPIQVSSTSNHTLEILQDGITVEGASRNLTLNKGEQRLITVSLVDGDVVVDDKSATTSNENIPDGKRILQSEKLAEKEQLQLALKTYETDVENSLQEAEKLAQQRDDTLVLQKLESQRKLFETQAITPQVCDVQILENRWSAIERFAEKSRNWSFPASSDTTQTELDSFVHQFRRQQPRFLDSSLTGIEWKRFGNLRRETKEGRLIVSGSHGWNGIITGDNQFQLSSLTIRASASEDVKALIGVHLFEEGDGWQGYTASILGQDGQVKAGHASFHFNGRLSGIEGRQKMIAPFKEFVITISVHDNGSIWESIDGVTTSGLVGWGTGTGVVGVFLERGTLEIHSMNLLPKKPPVHNAGNQSPQLTRSGKASSIMPTFVEARTAARQTLLQAFDIQLAKLENQSGTSSQDKNGMLINAIKKERDVFQTSGLIPFSPLMRNDCIAYIASCNTARIKAVKELDGQQEQLKKRNSDSKTDALTAQLQEERSRVLKPEIVGIWKHMPDGLVQFLHADGSMRRTSDTLPGVWVLNSKHLLFTSPSANAPGGAWIDTNTISVTGQTFVGSNQMGARFQGSKLDTVPQ